MANSTYPAHLSILQARYEKAMAHFELDAIVLASGDKSYYFEDDHSHPFRAYSGAQQWLPFTLGAQTYVVIKAGQKPSLIWPQREDFWHAPNPVPSGDWQQQWDISLAPNKAQWFRHLPSRTAWLGPQPMAHAMPCEGLKAYVDFDKAIKTPFEIHAIRQATERAVKGHMAAKKAFLSGKSELDIYLAFLQASRQTAAQEPYPGIVGLNEHAAVLHYEHKSSQQKPNNLTLLIDAGACEHGYASDITRTLVSHQDDFSALLNDLDTMQQKLCHSARTGVAFRDLHQHTLVGIAELLHEHKICALGVEEQLAKGIPQVFFPHGLGHLLGLQVHDVGGHQMDHTGHIKLPDDKAPFLRLTRTLANNMVITIEPGLYFIPMLLEKMQADIPQHGCDMARIHHLMPYGGIRIEDNLVVTDEAPENLTRDAFSHWVETPH